MAVYSSQKLNTSNKNTTKAQKEGNNDYYETCNNTVKDLKFKVGSHLYEALRANIKRRKRLEKVDRK